MSWLQILNNLLLIVMHVSEQHKLLKHLNLCFLWKLRLSLTLFQLGCFSDSFSIFFRSTVRWDWTVAATPSSLQCLWCRWPIQSYRRCSQTRKHFSYASERQTELSHTQFSANSPPNSRKWLDNQNNENVCVCVRMYRQVEIQCRS